MLGGCLLLLALLIFVVGMAFASLPGWVLFVMVLLMILVAWADDN